VRATAVLGGHAEGEAEEPWLHWPGRVVLGEVALNLHEDVVRQILEVGCERPAGLALPGGDQAAPTFDEERKFCPHVVHVLVI
jgi:hypothetical protein